jgi:hypothetical protein
VGLKLNGTHQLLAYADDVNLLEDNIGTIKKSMEALIDASKEVGLEISVEKTKYHHVIKPEEPLGRPRCRLLDNIRKRDGIWLCGLDWYGSR